MTAEDFLNLPMVEWQAAVDTMDMHERMALDQFLCSYAVKAGRAARYIARRQQGGNHDTAVKAQNRAARSIRQALGFTYKDDAITF